MNKRQEVKELSVKLKGISVWLYATDNNIMGDTLFTASKHLEKYSNAICCAGIICEGGDDCTSDHK